MFGLNSAWPPTVVSQPMAAHESNWLVLHSAKKNCFYMSISNRSNVLVIHRCFNSYMFKIYEKCNKGTPKYDNSNHKNTSKRTNTQRYKYSNISQHYDTLPTASFKVITTTSKISILMLDHLYSTKNWEAPIPFSWLSDLGASSFSGDIMGA